MQEGTKKTITIEGVEEAKKYILDRVICQLARKEENGDIPHKEYLDLEVVYRAFVTKDGEGIVGSVLITGDICRKLGIEADELDHAARTNTENRGFSIREMNSVLEKMIGGKAEAPESGQMHVCTNAFGMYGAAIMMYPDRFTELAEKLGSDLYILPSSVHEVIAITAADLDPDELKEMVSDINTTVVDDKEVLGNSVYRYSRATGQISIAA